MWQVYLAQQLAGASYPPHNGQRKKHPCLPELTLAKWGLAGTGSFSWNKTFNWDN